MKGFLSISLITFQRESCLIFCLTLALVSFSQKNIVVPQDNSRNFLQLDEGETRNELASFTLAGTKINGVNNVKINNIPLGKCNDTILIFEKSNFVSLDKLIDIFISKFDTTGHALSYIMDKVSLIDGKPFFGTDSTLPAHRINAIRIMYGKLVVNIPESAYSDLYEPNTCHLISKSSKRGATLESNWKVFQSVDEKRLYIYTIIGSGKNKFEVTWIITNGKYMLRILDKI